MAYLAMHNMELSDEEKIDQRPWLFPKAEEDQAAEALAKVEYPYGLKICLTQAEFDKLGLDPRDAEIGAMVHGHFMARVTCVSCSENETDGPSARVEMQIEDLCLECEDEENEEAEEENKSTKPKRKGLYAA